MRAIETEAGTEVPAQPGSPGLDCTNRPALKGRFPSIPGQRRGRFNGLLHKALAMADPRGNSDRKGPGPSRTRGQQSHPLHRAESSTRNLPSLAQFDERSQQLVHAACLRPLKRSRQLLGADRGRALGQRPLERLELLGQALRPAPLRGLGGNGFVDGGAWDQVLLDGRRLPRAEAPGLLSAPPPGARAIRTPSGGGGGRKDIPAARRFP